MMKRLLIAFAALITLSQGFGQAGNDTTKYTYYRYMYGYKADRLWAPHVMMIPQDTAFSKFGIAMKGGVFYIGNGSSWSPITGGSGITDSSALMRKANNLGDLTNTTTARSNLGLGTAATRDVPSSGDASSSQVVKGNDSRLTDSRTPVSHTHPLSDLTQSSATTGQVPSWNGVHWVPTNPSGTATVRGRLINTVPWGQSNSGGGAEDNCATALAHGIDTSGDSRIRVFDVTVWKVAHIGQSPFNTSGPAAGSPTSWFFWAKEWVRVHPYDTVQIVPMFSNATAISAWFSGTTRGALTDTILNRVARSGIDHLDLLLGDQGESDNGTSPATYNASVDSLYNTLMRQSWFSRTARIVMIGMPAVAMGAPSGYQGIEPTIKARQYGNNAWEGFARADNATVNSTVGSNPVHFDSYGQWIIAMNVMTAFYALPMRDFERNNGGGVNGLLIDIIGARSIHNDPAAGGARTWAFYGKNTDPTGTTGIVFDNSDTSSRLAMHLAGPSGSYLGTGVASTGTETNTDYLFYRNFAEYFRLNSSEVLYSRPITHNPLSGRAMRMYSSNTAGAPGIEYYTDGAGFATSGIGNSASTYPDIWYHYNNNNYKTFINSVGTMICAANPGPNSGNAVSVLDVRGSESHTIDTITGVTTTTLSVNQRTVLVITGSSDVTLYLPDPSTRYGREYIIKKEDAGSGAVKLDPQGFKLGGSTAIYNLASQNSIICIYSDGNNWRWTFNSNTLASALSLSAVGSSPNANGLSYSGGTLNGQPADGSNPGFLTATTQTIGGQKTFNAPPKFNAVLVGDTSLKLFAHGTDSAIYQVDLRPLIRKIVHDSLISNTTVFIARDFSNTGTFPDSISRTAWPYSAHGADSITTSSTSLATITTYTPAIVDGNGTITALIIGTDVSDPSLYYRQKVDIHWRTSGSTATIIASDNLYTPRTSGLGSPTISFAASGGNVLIKVTPGNSSTTSWKVIYYDGNKPIFP